MVVAHNLYAMNAQRQYNITGDSKKKSTEKLSSGYRINRAADDAAGLAISEKMRKQIRGLHRGTNNMEDGVSWVQIGDGAMAEVHDILQRMTELSVQGANGTLSPSDRQAIDAEIQQLKVEINRINETTKFNEKRIFSMDDRALDDNGELWIQDLEGAPSDFKIFDATYDDATGDVTYGGIIFNGERVPWTDIDANMVYMDGGIQKFHEGTWVYMDAQDRVLNISAKEGDEVPNITRAFNISADIDGLHLDNDIISWSDITNRFGETMEDVGYLNGTWTADYLGAKLTFEVRNAYAGIQGLVDSINTMSRESRYNLYASYTGKNQVQAVDAEIAKNDFAIRSTDVAKTFINGGYTLRADVNGLWLEDAGGTVNGSERTWADMGITSWDRGGDINSSFTYKYEDTDGVNDTKIAFTYSLSDVTSMDSVIDGLDGVRISADNVKNNYSTTLAQDPLYTRISNVVLRQNIRVSLQDEVGLGRDFNQPTQNFNQTGNGVLGYDATNHQVSVGYANGGSNVMTYTGSTSAVETNLNTNLQSYENDLITNKIMQLVAGIPDNLNLGPKDLRDLLGAGNVSAPGKMTDTVTVTAAMDETNGCSYSQVVTGTNYPCGRIDFSSINSVNKAWELVGSGFDSTCGTCSKHYSFKFVLDTQGGSTTSSGYRYLVKNTGSNPELQISVSSIVEKQPITGVKIAEAIMEAVKGNLDEHYQQYARDGATLYVHETRQPSAWSGNGATFASTPYQMDSRKNYSLSLTSAANGSQNLSFAYDHADYADQVKVTMESDPAGQYVKKGTGYELYDPAVHSASAQRFSVLVSYSDTAGGAVNDSTMTGTKTVKVDGKNITVKTQGNAASSRGAYTTKALGDMTGALTLNLRTNNYTSIDYRGNEKDNIAIDSGFKAYSVFSPEPTKPGTIKYEESIMILKSGDASNKLIIPRFSLNTACLGLNRANCVTQDACRNTIDMVNRALERVSERRSLYGALQNRMEHAIRSNENTEENTTAADSRIRDTDMAEEMVSYAKHNILEQAGQAMMAQANQMNQGVLSLLQ